MVRVLVVEDENRQRDVCVRALSRHGLEVVAEATAEAGLARIEKERFDALVTDLLLPSMSGIELLQRVQDLDEELGTIVVTGHGTLETAVEALRAGAHDYILKPLMYEELARKIDRLVEFKRATSENVQLRRALQERYSGQIIGYSDAMREVVVWAERAAATDATVLITGETGTGKQVVADAIHAMGPGANEPMLTVNVAALPENMVESELFGHERGAFTGAEKRRDGMLRATGRGTVFLDEIGELPLALQAKLLRALEAREILPVGSDRPVSFEARIVCATHRDLKERIKDGRFREDLYYRLNVLHIHIPPLRERAEDIPPLVHHLLDRLCRRQGRSQPVVSKDAMRAFCSYAWPGNVRELSNVLERALIVVEDDRLDLPQLPAEFRDADEPAGLALDEAVQGFERTHIAMVLRLCDGNRERAAAELDLSPATLYRKLDKLGLKGFLTGGPRG
ncbi:MAG: hypothetical protein CMJ85_07895 [Planctomycetes bacterium]|jgi:DNA-binding NtrC family response regulator|nr:hypothetical protein [Planctomycetota bacterium]